MGEHRMFAKTIVLSDAFLDMPMSARCLYFTLGMYADDDGFINNPKSVMRICGASQDDMQVLLAKKFILAFPDGVIVVKHWRINNYIRSDRYKPTKYAEHMSMLETDENRSYTFGIPSGYQPDTIGIPSGYQEDTNRDTQVKLSKDKLSNNIISPDEEPKKPPLEPQLRKRFDVFWEAYPKKVSKPDAERAWKKLKPDGDLTDEILKGLERAKHLDRRFRDSQYIPYPATWLNSRGWEDEFTEDVPTRKESSFEEDEFFNAACKRTK